MDTLVLNLKLSRGTIRALVRTAKIDGRAVDEIIEEILEREFRFKLWEEGERDGRRASLPFIGPSTTDH